jgi:hypothetical protein
LLCILAGPLTKALIFLMPKLLGLPCGLILDLLFEQFWATAIMYCSLENS